MKRHSPVKLPRRDFLVECGRAAAVVVVPEFLPGQDAAATDVDFHVHPHYREQTPLEPVLHKRTAAFDDFPLETEHDHVAEILSQWSRDLLRSPQQIRAIQNVLAPDFRGCSLRPLESKIKRSQAPLEVRQLTFAHNPSLGSEAFPGELQHYLSDFSQIVTAEFQVTDIDETSEHHLLTQVRYELVASGKNFYREQRVGSLELKWQRAAPGKYRLQQWRQKNEARSRATSPVYQDLTKHALSGNHSYSAQLLHGVDYWRTVLDGASRIDIYGHNGVSVGDIDGDGFDDLYVCQPAGLPNRLYRNRGDGTFADVTEASGVGVLENTACALFADFGNNGRQDLIVVCADGPILFLNDGQGKFRRKPDAFQFANAPQGTFTGAAAADYDRDGWLDIYFCLYVYYQGADQYKYPTPYYDANNGPPNFLLRNNRDGTFRDVTAQSGLNQNNTKYSFCCGWTDSNRDGWPDLYVANDFGRKNLYRNNGDGTFTDIAASAGVEDVGAGMSVCPLDYDNDGAEDLYVANMWTAAGERVSGQAIFRKSALETERALYRKHAMGNSLLRNSATGVFEDKTQSAGVGMGRWSWSSDTWDFDHDGFLDLYIANGMVSGPISEDMNSFFWRQVVARSPEKATPSHDYEQGWAAVNELIRADYSWSGFERNVFYANNGDGTFSDVSGVVGLDFLEDGRAFALADLDHDGRLEVLLKNRNAPQLRLLKNVIQDLPPSICFRLRGVKSNRDAIGASITLQTDAGRQTRTLQAGSGFLSQHCKELFFGLGNAKGPIAASIRWPSGLVQPIHGLSANHRVYVEEGSESIRSEPFRPPPASPSSPAPQERETLPEQVETWLLAPVSAPDLTLPRGQVVLLYFCQEASAALNRLREKWAGQGLLLKTVNVKSATDDTIAVFNLLYRSLFDRRRDLSLPTAFLINEQGAIVKIYQGALNPDHVELDFRQIPISVENRIAKALPFATNAGTFAFGRNNLSLGSTYFQRGYFDQAEAWFRLALRDDASSAEAHYGLGSVYLKQSKWTESRQSFEQAVKLNSSYPDTKPNAWNNLGLLATRQGSADTAIWFFKEALQLDPDHLVSLENLGNAYRQEARWEEARSILERALALDPESPEVNYSLGMVFAQTDQGGQAYTYLQRALQLRPMYPEAMNNLGVLYLRTKRRDEAVAEFESCIRLAPAFDRSYLNLARVYSIEGNRDKARAALLSLLQQHPDHVQARKALDELK